METQNPDGLERSATLTKAHQQEAHGSGIMPQPNNSPADPYWPDPYED